MRDRSVNTRRPLSLILLFTGLFCTACSHPPQQSAARAGVTSVQAATKPAEPATEDFLGVWASPAEIGGFSGTVLVLEKDLSDEIGYRMRFYTDTDLSGEIKQDERRGSSLTSGHAIYIPQASGFYHDGKPLLLASVTQYTLMQINGHAVLVRDDALKAYQTENKLYDYGILIRVTAKAEPLLELKKVEHPSIKLLYSDPNKPSADPFVHGPTPR